MASGRFYIGGKFQHGGVHRVKFAHHISGQPDQRKLNVDPFIARLINGRAATLKELQAVYSLPDALYLSEVLDLKEEQIYLQNKRNNNG